jgi:predicted kinase
MIVAIGGLSGSGKTFTALKLKEHFNCPYFSSDKLRKELANISLTQRVLDSFGKGLYSPSFTKKTYEELIKKSVKASRQKGMAIIDATFSSLEHQEMLLNCGEPFLLIFCYASDAAIKERLAKRIKDKHTISDGRWEIYIKQKISFQGFVIPENKLLKIDTENENYFDTTVKFIENHINKNLKI